MLNSSDSRTHCTSCSNKHFAKYYPNFTG